MTITQIGPSIFTICRFTVPVVATHEFAGLKETAFAHSSLIGGDVKQSEKVDVEGIPVFPSYT